MLSRLPWTPAPVIARKPVKRRLNRDRRLRLIADVAAFMKSAHDSGRVPTLLSCEGPIRNGVRSALCLGGWRWVEADLIARDIVETALRQIGAVRPTWLQGQTAEFQDGADVPRERCLNCHTPLLGDPLERFCSRHCKGVWRAKVNDRWQAQARRTEFEARRITG